MSILFDIRFQLDATINCTFSNLNSKVETMGLGTCRSREKMSEDELPNSIVSKVNMRKYGFYALAYFKFRPKYHCTIFNNMG